MVESVGDAASLRDESHPVEVVSSERAFAGKVWDIRRETFRYGDGEVVREFVDHTGAVAVLALDADERVLLIQQYRHPIGERDWELPAGLLDIAGEDPAVAAGRELEEEADLVAGSLQLLTEFYTTPGGSNESIRIYLARDLTATAEAFARAEEEADILVEWVPLDDAVAAVLDGRLHNSILMLGVLTAAAARDRGWSTLRDSGDSTIGPGGA
ncbi:NUDIX hydrolase [Plantibacter sp. VKM Ac-2885]|jgi:8-oxo-dGTP pyrophosphatase MutT (NUDIX family)|uniref:NUDIX domain-containing protein n=1 Tax=Plantibacter TaxID=190323 RepID=UPI0010C223F0|nr:MULTISPECIES: NUDIX hydrolase [Plantibacter]MBF4513303.1 NUDIX hydrolase [Plantibacter sp. VKM Ac-2885]TKJ97945.1 ADP-ribose pyrophosphatase [Plantibacter flavus]CAH0253975.1 Methanol dehydrogenase activator [Plantibacter cousiniae]